ncbi:MAG: hypothetical protein MZV70_11015 [Desulfobacterales bacterium]|nr:hypothetical protein [Desulfobacterales bacterium]
MPAIEKDLNITHAEAGSLFFILSIGYFITLMGSGFVSARLTHRWTMVLSIACAGVSPAGDGRQRKRVGDPDRAFSDRAVHRALSSLGHRRASPSFVSPRHWGKAIAIHEVAPEPGLRDWPLCLPKRCSRWYSWKAVLAVLGIGAILSGVLFARFGRVGRFRRRSPQSPIDRRAGPPAVLLADDPAFRPRHQRQPGDLHHAAAVSGERARPRARFRQHAARPVADSRGAGGLRQRLVHRPVRTQADHPGSCWRSTAF